MYTTGPLAGFLSRFYHCFIIALLLLGCLFDASLLQKSTDHWRIGFREHLWR